MGYKSNENERTYYKAYYQANAEKLKAYQKAYRQANAEKIKMYEKAYYHANAEKLKAYWRTHRQKLKETVLSHYSGGVPKCACCGEQNMAFLSIDHVKAAEQNKGADYNLEAERSIVGSRITDIQVATAFSV